MAKISAKKALQAIEKQEAKVRKARVLWNDRKAQTRLAKQVHDDELESLHAMIGEPELPLVEAAETKKGGAHAKTTKKAKGKAPGEPTMEDQSVASLKKTRPKGSI